MGGGGGLTPQTVVETWDVSLNRVKLLKSESLFNHGLNKSRSKFRKCIKMPMFLYKEEETNYGATSGRENGEPVKNKKFSQFTKYFCKLKFNILNKN